MGAAADRPLRRLFSFDPMRRQRENAKSPAPEKSGAFKP
jgi:hypothetical protein